MGRDFIAVIVMCATRSEARRIADSLLAKKFVACANIMSGIESKFWWKGKIDEASETLLMMKAKKAGFKKIESEIKKIHSYEVPEIIAIPIVAGSKDYLNWIKESVNA
jgi:periplasmic divalent cation tolerance protein